MNLFEQLKHAYSTFLQQNFGVNSTTAHSCTFELNVDEAKAQFGDISSNAAMILAKQLKNNPRALAQRIESGFKHDSIDKIEIAGPGFINISLTQNAFNTIAQEIFKDKNQFFVPSELQKQHFNIEFVSANPTGPLHFGHGRGGIIGDVLAKVLRFIGHDVTKEYYINDAGSQMLKLGNTLKIRCQQELGLEVQLPDEAYHGEYMITLAAACIKEHGSSVVDQDISFFIAYAKKHMLEMIKQTLGLYGIHFDVWFSEKSLHDSGAIDEALEVLKERGYLYEKEGALWFKATEFGDDKDRVVKKSTGELTYVAADIAYMREKIARGADHLIMTLGHDHHSYVVRLHALQQALGLEKYPLDVILYQLVKMKNEGQLVRMSKRAGNIVTLKDIIEAVGTDVARFFFLNRKADAQLEFDVALALKKTDENPVYYVQYAYVRTLSILEKAAQELGIANIESKEADHLGAAERMLLKKIITLKELLMAISHNHQTHLLTYYVMELAQLFHNYYAHNRVLDSSNMAQSRARLLVITILKDTLALALELLGVSRPKKM